MSLVVAVLLLAAAVAGLCGGRVRRLGALDLRSWRLLAGAVLVQLGGGLVGGPVYPLCLAASALLVLAFLARAGLPGRGLVAAGLLSNALVIGLNGAMPVSAAAAHRAGVSLRAAVADPRHEPATRHSRLRLLSDVVPVPLPLAPVVVSPGDLLVVAGLAELVVLVMCAADTRVRVRPHLPPLPPRSRVRRLARRAAPGRSAGLRPTAPRARRPRAAPPSAPAGPRRPGPSPPG